MADEEVEGVGLPQKGLNMIIKDALPDMRIANETREVLNQCCVEFIKHISKEAQIISSKDQRKTIYHDHVQKALKNLGFPREYVDAANSVLGECKIAAEKRLKRKNSRLDKCGIPEEQLWQMQQRLIEQARREEAEKQHAAFTQFGGFDHFAAFQNQMASTFTTQQHQQSSPTFLTPLLPSQQQTTFQQTSTSSQTFAIPQMPTTITTTQQSLEQLQQHQNQQQTFTTSTMPMPFGLTAQQLIVPESSADIPTTSEQSMSQLPELTADRAAQILFGGTKNENEDDEEENYDI
uniref:Protein Dr1 n=1 Tax=Meloidogyne hapla TaxID=6305 RepID=A0A1I8BXM3_MELHA